MAHGVKSPLCRSRNLGYAAPVEPIINLEDRPGKTVGRRKPPRDSFAAAMALQGTLVEVGKSQRRGICPRGVFRFHTFEEADTWTLKMLARRREQTIAS